jgi:hypothetical protein
VSALSPVSHVTRSCGEGLRRTNRVFRISGTANRAGCGAIADRLPAAGELGVLPHHSSTLTREKARRDSLGAYIQMLYSTPSAEQVGPAKIGGLAT